MDEVWRNAPHAALRLWQETGGPRIEANDAARFWGLQQGVGAADWLELALRVPAEDAGRDVEVDIGGGRPLLRCRRVALADGALLWLEPLAREADAQRLLARQLDLIQDFGRMGLFVRNLETGIGHWDRHVLRIFGLPEDAATPGFEDALRRSVHPDDAAHLQRHHETVRSRRGRGGVRFRIIRPDGELRHIQSLYQIQSGPTGEARLMIGVLIDDTEIHDRLAAEQLEKAFLGRAIELAAISVWRVDLKSQRIHFNSVGAALTGLDAGQHDTTLDQIRALVHPDDREAIVRGADRAVAGDQVIDVVARYSNLKGGWRTLLTRRVADRDEQGQVVALTGVSLDISAQVGESRRAEELAAHTSLVAEVMGIGFWRREAGDGLVHWDEQMYRIHGRDPARGPPSFENWASELVHPQDRLRMAELRLRAHQRWEAQTDAVFRAHDVDGRERWVHMWTRRIVRDGQRLSFGMHIDVTERHRAEARADRERERTRYALEAADVGIWERTLEGDVTYWNEAMYRLRGLDPSDPRPLAQILVETTHPDDHAVMVELVRCHVDDGVPYQAEFQFRHPDGSWHWLATRGRIVRDAGGRIVGMAGVNIDITERKRADALRAEVESAEQASRDKSAFMARMSHELRTPMNAVLGFAQLIELDAQEPPSPRQRDRLQHIREAGSRLMSLIDDVLDLARLDTEAPAPVPLQLADVVRAAAQALAGLAGERGVSLQIVGGPQAGRISADPRRLDQALLHLLAHTLRRQAPGASVDIGMQGPAAADDGMARITIRDPAAPLTPAEQAVLFEPFGDAIAHAGGSALGLSLARRAIEAMGGSVEIGAAPAGGSALCISLPALGDAAVAAHDAEPAPLVVLCVEDNPVNLMLVRELLAMRPGVRLVEAVDGGSGIDAALAQRPDVVLLDLQLPDMDGIDVMRRLRAEPSLTGCRIIALSANVMPEDVAQARAAGFDDYWTKPIQFDRFLRGIDTLAAGRLAES